MESKIKKNARKYEIDEELSNAIYYIKSISCGLNKKSKIGDYLSIENTRIFNKIRMTLNLKSNQLLGLIYFINGRFDEDEVIKLLSYVCR